jgi:hypothetical protein
MTGCRNDRVKTLTGISLPSSYDDADLMLGHAQRVYCVSRHHGVANKPWQKT